jgi:hypothetical protein
MLSKNIRVKSNYFHYRYRTILDIDDIAAYNKKEGLSLSPDEVEYLDNLAVKIGRKLTDSEILVSRKPIQSTVVTRFSTENLLLMVWKRIFFI